MRINLLNTIFLRRNKNIAKSIALVCLLLFFSNLTQAQSYTHHYIAPAPWVYFTEGNELIIATNSTTPVTVSIKKSDGTTANVTELVPGSQLVAGSPKVYRFVGNIKSFPMHTLNSVISDAGLIVIANQPITVNLRNVVSDQGANDDFIKGNSSLFSFGDAAVGNSFRVGYYRDGNIYTSSTKPVKPIYSVMAIENGTILKINGVPIATLSAGQSYLFQDRIGSFVETSGPAVMNTSAAYDQPTTGGGCYDGTSNPVPPISSLGTEYIVVRGNGNNISERTTVVASEDNTVVTVTNFTSTGSVNNTISYTLAAAGDFITFNNGIPGAGGVNTPEGQIYSASRIQSTKRVVAYSGTAENCEVDVATLAPISDCTGSTKIQAYKFRKYAPADDLPYFAYIILRDATEKVYVTTDNGLNNQDIETLPGVGVRRQLGSTGSYIIDFSNSGISNPNSFTLTSTKRLTVSMVQQGGGFSMSNFLTPLPEKALVPTYTQGDCASAILSADPSSSAPYQWYLDGVLIPGATAITHTAVTSGVYTVTTKLDCGNSAQSLPITINLCNIDRAVTKTVDNATPVIGATVNFTLTAKNLGPGNAINVVVTDVLPAGYTYVANTASAGTSYNNTTGKWLIGPLAANGASTATLVIKATVKSTSQYQNTATISGPQNDVTTNNDVASVTPAVVPTITLTSATGTDAQTICYSSSTAITPIVYTFGGTTTGATATLPAGLTGVYTAATTSPVANAKYTITGVPAITNGAQTYTVTTQGGPSTVNITGSLTVNGPVANPVFNTYTSTRCQGPGVVTYSAMANYADNITYSVSPAAAGTINASTGQMTWSGAFTGNATITASATGCSGPKTTSIIISVSSGGTVTPDYTTVCAVNNIGTLDAGGVTGTIIRWEYSTDAGTTWTAIANTSSTQGYAGLTDTRVYRVVSQAGACTEVYSATATISVSQTAVVPAQTVSVCSGNTFLVEPAGVPGGTVYSWSAPTVLSGSVTGGNSGSNVANITGNLTGNGTVRYTVTPRSGSCEGATFTITVTVYPPVVRTINYGGPYCKASGGTASPTFGGTTTGITSSTFSSTIGLSINVNTGVVDIANSQVGNYVITNTYSNGNCTSTATYNLSLTPSATVGTVVNPADICANSTATITLANVPNGNGSSYNIWSASSGGTNLGTIPFTTPNLSANTTYYVQAVNACGTSGRTAITVNIKSSTLSTPITPGTSSLCEGSTLQLANSTSGGVWGSSNTAIATINSSGLVTGISPGTVVISYIASAGCTSKTLTINARPSVSPITNTGDLCVGSSRTLTNATSGGSWSSATPAVATVNATTGEVTGVAIGTSVIRYTITGSGAGGCTNSATYTITVNQPSTLVRSGGAASQAVCAGGAITNIVYTYGGSATSVFVTGTISPANYAINTTNKTVTITGTFSSSVTYNVTTIGHTSPCEPIVLSGAITANPLPTASIAGTTSVCRNAAAPGVTFTGANGTAPYTFTYKINGGSDQTVVSTGNVATVSQATGSAGTFTYTLVSVRDASSTTCLNAASGSAVITVNSLPTASISAGTTVCQDAASPSITFTGTGGTLPYTFTYNINGINPTTVTTTAGNNSVTITAPTNAVGTFNYNLVSVQDASSTACVNTATGTAAIVVNPLPTATIGGTTAVCLNATSPTITFTGATGTGPYTFTYKINGGSNQTITTTSGSSVTVNAPTATAGTFVYSLVSVKDASSTTCTNVVSGSATVTVNPLPTASISGTIAVCRNATAPEVIFTGANGTAPYTFTYKINGGSDLTIVSTGNIATVSQPTGTASSYIYTLVSVKDASSTTCTNTASGSATITVNPLPTASISGNTTVCLNATAPAVTFTGANGTAPYTFTYKINGGSDLTVVSTGNTATVNQATGTVNSFVYTLVSVKDASSTTCSNTASGTATVTVKPLPTAVIGGTTAVCVNATSPNVTFTGSTGTAPYTFTYTINGGSPLTVTTTSGSSVTVAAPTGAAGTFTYALVSVSDAGTVSCDNSATGTAVITVNPLPTASISGSTEVCVNATAPAVTFTGANGTAPFTFTYKINGGSDLTVVSTGNTATVTRSTATAGTFTYTLVSVRDASGTTCLNSASGTAVIKVNPLPTATISGTTAVCRNATAPTVTFTGANGTAPFTFTYKINGGSDLTVISTGNTATVSQATGTANTFVYTLVGVKDASSTTCTNSATGTATVTVNPLPTATISGTTAVCRNAASPNITFTGAAGTAPYTFTYDIDGGSPLTVTTAVGNNSVTIAAPTTTVGSFVYHLLSVKDASSTTCSNTVTGSATITINAIPQGSNSTTTVGCTGVLAHDLQNNISNGITSTFTWTAVTSGNVIGAANGSGSTINQTLYNTSTTAQTVTYTVTPKATGAGTCDGNTFTVTVTVPVCSSLSITKNTSVSAVNAVGNTIPYTITVVNTGNANQTNVVLTDALLGGVIGSPVKTGGNTDTILEKGETWTYTGTYTVTQADLNNNGNPSNNSGKITNAASVVTDQISGGQTATKDVTITLTPAIKLVKTGLLNLNGNTIGYTFTIRNTGNVTISGLTISDSKVATVTVSPTTIAPGATATGTATYTILTSEKATGFVSNTATATGNNPTGGTVSDVSGTAENNDNATVTYIGVYPLNDLGTVNGVSGGTAVANVLVNDEVNGVQATTTNVTIAQISSSNANISINSSGVVTVLPNTPVGTYTLVYEIEDKANLGNKKQATVAINVVSGNLIATDDSGVANSILGGEAVANILTNDTYNTTLTATTSNVDITENSNNSAGKVTLNTTNGKVNVAAGTPAGTYTINYTITDKLDVSKTSSANIVVTVSSGLILAVADAGTANSITGNSALLNVLANDKFNDGTQATIADVTITQNTNNSSGKITLTPATGVVSVAAGTPAGTYTINYTITDKLDASKTSSADVVVVVSSNAIQAVADAGTANSVAGNPSLLNVLDNDKFNGGTQATIADVTITQNTNNSLGKITLTPATGVVSVAAGTPAGTYTINYTITDKLDASKTSSADVVIVVSSNAIQAVADAGTANSVVGNPSLLNVLDNDKFNGGTQATIADVTITQNSNNSAGKVTLTPATGVVSVAAGTPAGTYTINYTITDKLDVTKTSSADVVVVVASGTILATNDNGTANSITGGEAVDNILTNDTYNNGLQATIGNVTITQNSNNSLGKVTLTNATGAVNVAAGTPAGTYTINYTITDKLDVSKTSSADVVVVVSSNAIQAVADAGTANSVAGNPSLLNVLDNDKFNGGTQATIADVTITQNTNNSLGKITLTPATGVVSVAAGTPAGTYTINYTITDKLDASKTSSADVVVVVSSNAIQAVADAGTANSVAGNPSLLNVLDNDKFNGGTQATIADVTITQNSNNSAGKVTLTPATGVVSVAAGTPAGSYTINYTITDKLDASKTSSADVVVVVSSNAILAVDDSGTANGVSGNTAVLNILGNDKFNGGTQATITDVTITENSNNSLGKVTLTAATGVVSVAAGTPAGTYTINYTITDKLDVTKTSSANAVITVSSGAVQAVADSGVANSITGGTAVSNILANDKFNNGSQATTSTVNIAENSNDSNGKITLSGATVTVAAGTPAGVYTINYTITDKLDGTKTSNANIVVTVSSGVIVAANDAGAANTITGGVAVEDILVNDTFNNGTQATINNVNITENSNTSNGKITLNTANGKVTVAAGTPAGVYVINYTITDQLDASKTASAAVTVTVSSNAILATNDTGVANTITGGVAVANILANDSFNGGSQATLANVTITENSNNSSGKVTLANGVVSVAANTTAGVYTINYTITDKLDPSKTSSANIVVTVSSGSLLATNDNAISNTVSGGLAISNILANDRYNGSTTVAPLLSDVTILEIPASNTSACKVVLNTATGTVTVAPNTPAGVYTVDYSITDKLDLSKIDTAKITITVTSGAILASNDSGSANTITGGTAIVNILNNDRYNGSSTNAPTTANVNILEIPGSNSSAGKVTLNINNGEVTVAANTQAGIYTIDYSITDKLDASKIDTARIIITVASGSILATQDLGTANTVIGGVAVANILANDTFNNTTQATTATVTITENSNNSAGKVTLNVTTGEVSVAANTPAGVYVINYTITDKLDPSKTATTNIIVTISSQILKANNDNGTSNTVNGGVAIANILVNDRYNGSATIAPTLANVTITEIPSSNTSNGKVNLNADGSVTVLANTQAGIYTFDYSITDKLDATKIDTARVTVEVASGAILATNDNGSANAINGGVAIANILSNDKFNNGVQATVNDVAISEITGSNTGLGKITLNTVNGEVVVAPNTPAGVYTIDYSITDKLDVSKIDTARITITVSSAAIHASNDNGAANSINGGVAVANILSNDTFNGGTQATLANVTITEIAGSNTSAGKATLNTATGEVTVAANTPAGTYTIGYSITDKLDAAKVSTAIITVVVSSGAIQANNDNGAANTVTGGVAIANILSNDTFNGGTQATIANVTITEIAGSNTSAGKVTLNTATGQVSVAPNIIAGTYTIDYTITDQLDASKTSTAKITVIVSSGILQASNDNGSVNTVTGGIAIPDILANDKYNATTLAPTTANVTITEIAGSNTSAGKVTLNTATGQVNVAANTPAGTYTIDYSIVDKLDVAKTANARITVVVSAGVLQASDDNGTSNAITGGVAIANILDNDKYNGTTVAPSLTDVTISEIAGSNTSAGKITLNPLTGAVTVAAATPAATYTIDYKITDLLDPTKTATAKITVVVASGAIQANNDSGTINGFVGGTAVANVLANDSYNGGSQASLANVNLTQVSTSNANVTLDVLSGKVNVTAGTPAGVYTLVYEIVDQLDASKNKQATVTVTVNAPNLVANNNAGSVNGVTGGTAVQNVLANDTYNGNTATLSTVTISQVSTTNANVTIDPTTGKVNVAAGTPEAVYILVYKITDNLNPTLAKQATVTVTVSAAPMIANDDNGSVNGLVGGVAIVNVLGNDTYNGNEATLSDVILTQISTTNIKVTLDPLTKQVNVAPNTPAGTYTIVYQIEDRLNPGQTKQATVQVVVDAPDLMAANDNGSINGLTGGTAITNVLWNDTYNGNLATTATVTIAQVSTTDAKVTVNANGEVNIAPNTPADTYTIVYQIEDKLNPGLTKQATIVINVTAPSLAAANDSGSANGFTGGVAVPNVLVNDSYNGFTATTAAVTITQISTTNPNVTIDATGKVSVAPNTPAAIYTLVYQIEDKLNPGQVKQATVTVTVNKPAMIASDDSRSVNGLIGGVAIPNVLTNDTYNGNPATLNEVLITQISSTSPRISLDPTTGEIEVLPNTPAGTYTLVYQIEDKLNPGQTKQATVTITVTAPSLVAANDNGSINGLIGGIAVPNVLVNDTYNGQLATTAAVTVTQISSTDPKVTIDVNGQVKVAANTPAGVYTLVYQIEDKLNPGQQKVATVVVNVTAPALAALNDSGAINGLIGGVAISNVLWNDTYNGNLATTAAVTISQVSSSDPKVTIDANGQVIVAANTLAGTYTLVYQIEDKLNPGLVKQATVIITVNAPAIATTNDSGSVNGLTGGTPVTNVLVNDTYNGNPATLTDVTLSQVSSTNANVSLDSTTGKVNVAPNTPAGTYTLVYQIEDKLNPGQTKQATVTITVSAPALVATNDNGTINGLIGGEAHADILANDTYNGNPATLSNVSLTQISTSNTSVNIDATTGKVNVAPNTPAGTYTLVYQIEDKLNPGLIKQATVTIIVTAPLMVATNDNGNANGFTGGTAVANVLINDTYNGNPATLSDVIVTQVSTSDAKVTIDANGKVTVAPNTPAGTYTLVYQIEDQLNPGQKKTATVTIVVAAPTIVATNDTGSINGLTGGTAVTDILSNDTYNGAPATLNEVSISQISTSNPSVQIDALTGKVNVAPNTPAGLYTLTYEIEDRLNPGLKKTATVTITVTAPTMVATADTGAANGLVGAVAVANVLVNDTYNGAPATLNEVTITQVSTSNPKVTLDPATGKVNVAPNTPAGTYTLVYQIEDKLNPGQTKQATVTITVTAPAMVATNDSGTINGATGGTVVANILANDTYNGNAATVNEVTITQVSSTNPNVAIDPATGKVNVAPNTPTGTYTLVYEIEDKLNPGQKKTATITVNVTSGTITANPDAGTILGFFGGTIQMDILANDVYNGNSQATVSNVVITQLSTENPKINIDPTNGKIIVQARTLPGVYVLNYQITDKLDPTNKTNTTVTITIPNWITDLTVTKTANKTGVEVNEQISYTITVKNIGTATVLAGRAIVLNETLPTGLDNVTYIATGGTYNATANTFTTAADVDAGQSVTLVVNGTINANYAQNDITNSVTVNAAQLAMDPNPNNNAATITTPILRGKIALSKAGTMSTDGNTITYAFTIKNVGNVVLDNINLIDAKIGLNVVVPGTLAVGSSTVYTKVYTLTQADKDLGSVTNTASVSAKSPAGNTITDISGTDESNDNPTIVNSPQSGSLIFTKVVSGTIPTVVGAPLNYTFKVTNTGNVTLINIVVTDVNATITGSPITSLLPGASANLTAVHILTQADVDAGLVTNQASIVGKDPKGNSVSKVSDDPSTGAQDDPTIAIIPASPAYTLTKVANNTGAIAGDVITYTITVKNTGNVTLTNVVVTDANATLTGATIPSLAPGAAVNVTATHILTQNDVNAGTVINQANATAKDPKGNNSSVISDDPNTPAANDPTIIMIGATPGMVLTKTANNTGIKAGDVINYTLIVKNTGNVTLTNVTVADAGADAGSILPANIATILPGATAVVTAKHTLTQTEINAGRFSNQASVSGRDPKNNIVADPLSDDPNTLTPDDPTVVILTPNADLVTVKRLKNVNQTAYIPGDEVVYNINIKNNGPSAASNVRISDYAPLGTSITKWTATAAGLTLPYTYGTGNLEQTIALFPGQAQVDYEVTVKTSNGATRSPYAGTPLVNTVKVTSSTPDLSTIGDLTTTAPLPADIRNDLSIAKTSDHITPTGVDTPYDYTILIKNSGFFTANTVVVTDVLPAQLAYVSHVAVAGSANHSNTNNTVVWTIPSLQPGAVAILTIKVKATKAGVISNTATVKANETDPNMDNNSATDLKEIFELNVKPNVITPNGDGKNDTWVIDGLELYPENFLTIFNRWGNEVYHSNGGYKNDWGGNGLKEGTYYYLLKVKDTKGVWTVTKGYITLLRNN